jgi:HSP90 family molecular chaperone
MKEDQKHVYYLAGGNEETIRRSPLLEGYKKKGIEVEPLHLAELLDRGLNGEART